MFRVGQKVVCVNNGPMPNSRGRILSAPQLVNGAIYHVVAVDPDTSGIFVAEAKPRPDAPCGFNPRRFRPVVERKTDISIFTRMLTERVVEVDA